MRLIKILLLIQLIISLNSCGPLAYKKTDAKIGSWDPEQRVKKNLEEGRGFRLFDDEKKLVQLMILPVQTNFGVQH